MLPTPTLLQTRIAISSFFILHGFVTATWISRIPAEKERLEMSAAVLGLVLLGNMLGALLGGLTAGIWVAWWGSRRVARTFGVAASLSLPLLGALLTPAWLFAGLVLYGFLLNILNIGMNTQAAALEARYGRPIFSSFHALWSAGALLGSLAGAGLAGLGLSPFWHFLLVGGTGAGLAWQAGSRLLAASPSPQRQGFVLPKGALLVLGLMGFCTAISDGSIAGWSGVYLRSLGAPESLAALGFAVHQAVMLVGRSSGDWLVQQFGAVQVVRYGSLLGSFGLAVAVVSGTVEGMFFGIACMGLGMATLFPLMFAAAAQTPGMPPAAAIASISTMSTFGGLVGPMLLGIVAEVGTVRASFAVAALLAGVVSYLAFSLAGYQVARTQTSD
ncbi:MFS transporter [Meiothermus taiwanensis]|jgi:MFS family permease|uniref:Inner membrane protein YbjJ n=3 Tax=Meiothermus taiwanensis TaxID=172827 RepID=A0A399E860_9DEIN|nr:MFS transporter [Meiothermus taiwanensis]AWR85498.1 major facilitator superfamily protein [Meiothermus taiwanensis WR-220]KIQ55655.1 MFS transporter [Meiothermus taiwanensis]KZK16430.1 MFS transporter [Meiothermus taiwanensis]RIH80098.1 Inner membrane protein YbjJ [Meiothermus taiwanensis]